jgi:hypothetical protein
MLKTLKEKWFEKNTWTETSQGNWSIVEMWEKSLATLEI